MDKERHALSDPLRINSFGISESLRKTGKSLCNRKHTAYPSLCVFVYKSPEYLSLSFLLGIGEWCMLLHIIYYTYTYYTIHS